MKRTWVSAKNEVPCSSWCIGVFKCVSIFIFAMIECFCKVDARKPVESLIKFTASQILLFAQCHRLFAQLFQLRSFPILSLHSCTHNKKNGLLV